MKSHYVCAPGKPWHGCRIEVLERVRTGLVRVKLLDPMNPPLPGKDGETMTLSSSEITTKQPRGA